jgi:hypothetical protein
MRRLFRLWVKGLWCLVPASIGAITVGFFAFIGLIFGKWVSLGVGVCLFVLSFPIITALIFDKSVNESQKR